MQISNTSAAFKQAQSRIGRRETRSAVGWQARVTAALSAAAGCVLVSTVPLSAQEACVRCDEPFAVYRCQVSSPDLVPNSPVQFMCITELAKRYGHRTCAVSRDQGPNCAGELVVIAPPADIPIAPPPNLAAQPEQPIDPNVPLDPTVEVQKPADQEETVASPEKDEPPETVEDLAKQAADASKKGLNKAGKTVVDAAKTTGKTIEKTGDAIGSAAKKTWRCLSSMFGDC